MIDNKNSKQPRYAWEKAQEIIHKYIEGLQLVEMQICWIKAQLIIEAQARYYSHVGNDVEDSVSMAWEDFEVACRGAGEPGITGAIFMLWSRLPKKEDKYFKFNLENATLTARGATDPNALRYMPKVYQAKVQTPENGFDLPEAIPLRVVPVLPSVPTTGALKSAINKITDFSVSPFQVFEGGKSSQQADEPDQPEDELF